MFVSRLKSSDGTLSADSFWWPQTVIYRCVPPLSVYARPAYLMAKPACYKRNSYWTPYRVGYAMWLLDNDSLNACKRFFFSAWIKYLTEWNCTYRQVRFPTLKCCLFLFDLLPRLWLVQNCVSLWRAFNKLNHVVPSHLVSSARLQRIAPWTLDF